MPVIEHQLKIADTQEIRLLYRRPVGELNWGIDLEGSDLEHDVSTPLVLMLHDFPGCDLDSHDNLLNTIAQKLEQKGVPSLGVEYRGCGFTSIYSGHFDLDTAVQDVEAALKWVLLQDTFTKIIPVVCGASALVAMKWIEAHDIRSGSRFVSHKKEKSLVEMVSDEGAMSQEDMQEQLKMSHLSLSAMAMFWPLLEPRTGQLLRAYEASEHAGREDGPAGFSEQGVAPFTGMPVRGGLLTFTDDVGHKVSMDYVRQLGDFDVNTGLQKATCPLLVQQGADDETVSLGQLDVLKENSNNEYLDIQIYGGGDHGLAQENLRSHILRLTEEFITRFV